MNILVTGSSGLIGTALCRYLENKGHIIHRMVRDRQHAAAFFWQPTQNTIEYNEDIAIDAVINLAGENIADGRWTKRKKNEILQSRVSGTQLLCETLAKLTHKPRLLINGSAMGYYGDTGDVLKDEQSPPGNDFLAEVAVQWENAAKIAEDAGIRTIYLRTGLVLSPNGGALGKMLLPFKCGLGGRMGSGDHYMSWISITDVWRVFDFLLTHETIAGPVNMVAKHAVTNREFTKALGQALHRPTVFPFPAIAAQLIFGEMAEAALLSSIRVYPKVLEKAGFEFEHEKISDYFKNM